MNNDTFWNRSKKDILKLFSLFLISLAFICVSIYVLKYVTSIIFYFITFLFLVASSITACAALGVFIFVFFDYNSQKKYKKIVMENLTDDYKPVYINTAYLQKSALLLYSKLVYKAKLDSNGYIILKIESISDSNDFYKSITLNYSWFCQMFSFEE